MLAFPSGRLEDHRLRVVMGFGYAIAILGPTPIMLFSNRIDEDCQGCPPSAILITDNETLEVVFNTITSVLAVVLVGYVLYVLLQRWQRATHPQRRALAPDHRTGASARRCGWVARCQRWSRT